MGHSTVLEYAATATIIDYTADSDTANPIYQYEL